MKKKKFKLITRTDRIGFMFVLPFLIGFIWLFMYPLVQSLIYTFHRVTVGATGMELQPIKWENYHYLFFKDDKFIKEMITQGKDVVVQILVIMFVSIFLAILLNAKFTGRLLFRTLLFLPVIFAADSVMQMFKSLGGEGLLDSTENSFMIMGNEATGFVKELIASFGPLSSIIEKFTGYVNSIFNVIGMAGIQIILFIIGLQSIPSHLYEVAKIEGATKWEEFWKITFPLLTPSMLLCLVFTIIRYFNADSNKIINMIQENKNNRIDYSCTISWVYSLIVLLLVLIVYKIVSRKTIYLD